MRPHPRKMAFTRNRLRVTTRRHPPPHLARHHLLPLSCPPLNTDALHHLRGRRLRIILKGILTQMELGGTEEILLESFNYLLLLLKDKSRFSTGDKLGFNTLISMTVLLNPC